MIAGTFSAVFAATDAKFPTDTDIQRLDSFVKKSLNVPGACVTGIHESRYIYPRRIFKWDDVSSNTRYYLIEPVVYGKFEEVIPTRFNSKVLHLKKGLISITIGNIKSSFCVTLTDTLPKKQFLEIKE